METDNAHLGGASVDRKPQRHLLHKDEGGGGRCLQWPCAPQDPPSPTDSSLRGERGEGEWLWKEGERHL